MIVIDIGGTNTRIGISNKHSINVVEKFKTIQEFEIQVKKIIDIIKKIPHKGKYKIGIAMPGPADYSNGIFFKLPNIPNWEGKNIISEIQKYIDADIKTNNDANLMALAHHHYFNNNKITQFYTISTGLGSGLIINNEIFMGANGFAQEVAWAPLAFSKKSGKGLGEGSLELFSSGSGIEFQTGKESSIVFGNSEHYASIINNGIDALANCIATSVAMIDPNLFVFDGSVARNNWWYIEKAIEKAKTRMDPNAAKKIKFKASELNDDAALIGASYLF